MFVTTVLGLGGDRLPDFVIGDPSEERLVIFKDLVTDQLLLYPMSKFSALGKGPVFIVDNRPQNLVQKLDEILELARSWKLENLPMVDFNERPGYRFFGRILFNKTLPKQFVVSFQWEVSEKKTSSILFHADREEIYQLRDLLLCQPVLGPA